MTIENFLLAGPAGPLECLLRHPGSGQGSGSAPLPAGAAAICHPHPLFGGTMHNKVVHAAATALGGAGLPVLRFNFRGVGASGGSHDNGRGEQQDLQAVLDHLAGRYPGVPLLVCGYSFGSWVGLKVGCPDRRVAALIGIGLPIGLLDFGFLAGCAKPLTLIQGERDAFGPLAGVMALAASLPSGGRVVPVPAAEHNFAAQLDELSRRVAEAVPGELRSRPDPR